MTVRQCEGCAETKVIKARGLCKNCYMRLKRTGRLDSYRRVVRPTAEVAEEYAALAGRGYTLTEAAREMGMTLHALTQSLRRSRAAASEGDPAAEDVLYQRTTYTMPAAELDRLRASVGVR